MLENAEEFVQKKMTCLHQPYTGKPVHVSRLWIKRDGRWVMSISFQTTVQATPAKTS